MITFCVLISAPMRLRFSQAAVPLLKEPKTPDGHGACMPNILRARKTSRLVVLLSACILICPFFSNAANAEDPIETAIKDVAAKVTETAKPIYDSTEEKATPVGKDKFYEKLKKDREKYF